MTREIEKVDEESVIRATLDALTEAVRAKDAAAFLAHCAPGIVAFDMLPPLAQQGEEPLRRSWATALSAFEGPARYEVSQLHLAVSGDVAFTRSLDRFGGTRKDGQRIDNWLRSTLGLRKIDGRWKLVHQHVSVPFDMQSGRALLDLQP